MNRGGPGLDRRSFLGGAIATALLLPAARFARAASALPRATIAALESSDLVYVSPLQANGDESRCHGEVWFAWLGGAVVLISSRESWKARSLAAGRDRARIWAGSHGRWKTITGRNEAFRQAPSFDARAQRVEDPQLLDALIAVYEKKYTSEIERWRERFRDGYASGERWILRYAPIVG